MCAIIELQKGVSIPIHALENVVWNNPHGYGLIIVKGKNQLEVIKDIPEGGTNPKSIQELLDKYKKFHRFLHLRWKTEGTISSENSHPFLVYDGGPEDQVYFMHNGTLQDYKPVGQDERSDSKIFAEEFLKPLLNQFKGDYCTDFAKKIITKFWGYGSNRGLLVSNKYVPMYINYTDWKEIKLKADDGSEVIFKASNDTYFEKLTRGYEFERREEEKKASQSVFSFPNSGSQDWPVLKLKDIDLSANQFVDIQDIFADIDLYTEAGTASLANLTATEILAMNEKDPELLLALFVHVTGMYNDLWNEFLEVEEKHDRASKKIATLVNERKVG